MIDRPRPLSEDLFRLDDNDIDQLARLRAEQHQRFRGGEQITVGRLLASHRVPATEELVLDLIYSETLLRGELGLPLKMEEHVQAFPQYESQLRQQFEFLSILNEDLALKNSRQISRAMKDETQIEAVPSPALPEIPGYRIIRELGRGGMGIVYEAVDLELGRGVAIKTLTKEASANDQQRLRSEATAIARLQHPNIVSVHSVNEIENRVYLVLELVQGGSLADELEKGPLSPRRAAIILEMLARAIHAVHEKGIVHRDLTPGNILLQRLSGDEDLPRISDFGLARLLDTSQKLTAKGEVLGTPRYMAPEQVEGSGNEIGPSIDIYALGALLYEMLTGRSPFSGRNVLELFVQIRTSDPLPLSRAGHRIHRDLETITLKCLDKTPSRRYETAQDLAEDLKRFLDGEPIRARGITRREKLFRWCSRHPSCTVACSLLALFCLILFPLWHWFSNQIELSRVRQESSDRIAKTETQARMEAVRAQRQAQQLARAQKYFSLLSRARSRRSAPSLGWTWRNLDDLRTAHHLSVSNPEPGSLRTEMANALGAFDLKLQEVLQRQFICGALAFSPDGQWLAVGEGRAAFFVLPIRVLLINLSTNKVAHQFTFLPRTIWKKRRVAPDGARSIAFSPDNQKLFVGSRSGRVFVWDLTEPSKQYREWSAFNDSIDYLIPAPDRSSIFTGSEWDSTISQWSTKETGKLLRELKSQKETTWNNAGVAVTPDGKRLLTSDGGIVRSYVENNKFISRAQIRGWRMALSQNGKLLASMGFHKELQLVDASKQSLITHFPAQRKAAHRSSVDFLQFSPDGSLLLSLCYSEDDRKLKIWETSTSRLLTSLTLMGTGEAHASFHPNKPLLAVATGKGVFLYRVLGVDIQQREAQQLDPIRDFCFGREKAAHSLVTVARSRDYRSTRGFRHTIGVWSSGREKTKSNMSPLSDSILLKTATGLPVLHRPGEGLFSISPTNFELQSKLAAQKLGVAQFDPSGKRLWGIADKLTLRSWDWKTMKTGEEWRSLALKLPSLYSLDVSSNWILVGGRSGQARLLQSENTELVKTILVSQSPIDCVAISPDETLGAFGSGDGWVHLHAIPSGQRLTDLSQQHFSVVTSLAFSPNGEWLVTGGADKKAHLYRRFGKSFDYFLTLDFPESIVRIRFNATGDRLGVLVDGESAVRIWRLDRLLKSIPKS